MLTQQKIKQEFQKYKVEFIQTTIDAKKSKPHAS